MSKIYELLGYPLEACGADVEKSRRNARCPFMNVECDGGGNRYASALRLKEGDDLFEYFLEKPTVQTGVCSLLIGQKPWIVCPRRLLTLHGKKLSPLQSAVRERIVRYADLSPTKEYRVWSEVKMTVPMAERSDKMRLFNYTFDYVVADKTSMPISRISEAVDMSEEKCLRIAEQNDLEIARRDGSLWLDDWPSAPLVIVEVMSSSTSGGNKKKRTQIGMAFQDALLKGEEHEGPGINYRQVWARMASQLIVKSQVATAWNAKTIWLLQDVLADYISTTTGLNLETYAAHRSNEVNILSVGYDDESVSDRSGVLPLVADNFYSGPVSAHAEDGVSGGFVDIVKIGTVPPVRYLWKALFRKRSCGVLTTSREAAR